MKLATFTANGRTSYGVVVNGGVVDLGRRLKHASLTEVLRAGALAECEKAAASAQPDVALKDVVLQPPLPAPEKILCIGVNYANRNAEYKDGSEQAKYPSMFFRNPGSFTGHDQPLIRPPESTQLDYEGEIALIIGREGRRIPKARAMDHVVGYTLCNEGTIRDWTRHSKFNVTQGKNFDATGSIGPWIETEVDLSKPLSLVVRKNGEITQEDTTANMIFSFAELIAYVTTFMTLKPGDIISTGTPVKKDAKVDPPVWLKPGDAIEIECPAVGVLRNSVADEA